MTDTDAAGKARPITTLLLAVGMLAALGVFAGGTLHALRRARPDAEPDAAAAATPFAAADALAGIPGGADSLPVREMPDSYWCGPAALQRILRKWGDPVSMEELARLAKTAPDVGTSLAGLQQAALARGALSNGVEMDYVALRKQTTDQNVEVIVHVEPAHYYWVRHASADGVAIQDESSPGTRWMNRGEFEAQWSGKALLVRRPVTTGRGF